MKYRAEVVGLRDSTDHPIQCFSTDRRIIAEWAIVAHKRHPLHEIKVYQVVEELILSYEPSPPSAPPP